MAGLLTKIKKRWACLPLACKFHQPKNSLECKDIRVGKEKVTFKTKLEQETDMVVEIFNDIKVPIIAVTDSWFGNDGPFGPTKKQLGGNFNLLARQRCNVNVLPKTSATKKKGRLRKYGNLLGNVSELASLFRDKAKKYFSSSVGLWAP